MGIALKAERKSLVRLQVEIVWLTAFRRKYRLKLVLQTKR